MENQPATSHISSGWRKILDYPFVFNFLHLVLGAGSARNNIINKYCRPQKNARMLEIGCGTGDILKYVDRDLNIDYWGFDMNPTYIDFAKKKFADRGRFYCAKAGDRVTPEKGFDIVLAVGILHHLDDNESKALIETAYKSLKPEGFFLSAEPVFTANQSRLEKYLMSKDRGQNIRDEQSYLSLLQSHFLEVDSYVVSDSILIPWTVMINRASKSSLSTSTAALAQ